uniref:Hedgehog/Intein (Hint) domain-containing protein n=1 Tax=viral metagenome TaxID=1070528 RepID=A0A6C0DAG6_9ZZZZ
MAVPITLITSANFTDFNGGDFTRTRGFASSDDGKRMYATIVGTSGYGIMISTDYGVTWSSSNPNDGNTSWSITSIACSSDGTIVYGANLGNGLYKSIDSGVTWSYITSGAALSGRENIDFPGVTTYNVYQVACDATGNKLIMTTNFSEVIYRSIDGGITWTDIYTIPNSSLTPQTPILLTSNVNGSILYAAFNGTDNKIYKSTDNGTTWSPITTIGNITGPFHYISTNLTGDFIFASDNIGNVNIFYETHAAQGVLTATNGSLFLIASSYNNGNSVIVMKNNTAQTFSVQNLFPPGPIPGSPDVPCFNEGTKILCYRGGKEKYINIEDIRSGYFVKTLKNGYVRVSMIGTSKLNNNNTDRLYICKTDKYKELTENLIITGGHAILTNSLTDEQKKKSIDMMGKLMYTDNKYRLLVCLDNRASLYEKHGVFNIWHLALENDNWSANYGIYANGLLVESCTKKYLKEKSGMTLIE